MKNTISIGLLALFLALTGCLSSQAKQFNRLGDDALNKRNYEGAISYYSQSLSIAADQEEVKVRLGTAKVLLKQIYTDKIYDLVDKGGAPVGEFYEAYRMSSRLPTLKVKEDRINTIRRDLTGRFVKAEPRLRKSTEGHNYWRNLTGMYGFVKDPVVAKNWREIGVILRGQHLALRAGAEGKKLPGLALLHTAAAATFAPWDTSLWPDAARRRRQIQTSLAIPLAIDVRSASSSGHDPIFGGIRGRIPSIFKLDARAPLHLAFRTNRPNITEREVHSRHSASCQVGVQKVKNKQCGALQRKAQLARQNYNNLQRGLDQAISRCSTAPPVQCNSYISNSNRDLGHAKGDYEKFENMAAKCPEYLNVPVFKVFFYQRHTIYRQVTTFGDLTVTRNGTAIASRPIRATAKSEDTYGDGLACAKIRPDRLNIQPLGALEQMATKSMLDGTTKELLAIRREKAKRQLEGGDSDVDSRLDGLVRARLIDDSFELARSRMADALRDTWSSDFKVPDGILR